MKFVESWYHVDTVSILSVPRRGLLITAAVQCANLDAAQSLKVPSYGHRMNGGGIGGGNCPFGRRLMILNY